jgi:hypothetical protein
MALQWLRGGPAEGRTLPKHTALDGSVRLQADCPRSRARFAGIDSELTIRVRCGNLHTHLRTEI